MPCLLSAHFSDTVDHGSHACAGSFACGIIIAVLAAENSCAHKALQLDGAGWVCGVGGLIGRAYGQADAAGQHL